MESISTNNEVDEVVGTGNKDDNDDSDATMDGNEVNTLDAIFGTGGDGDENDDFEDHSLNENNLNFFTRTSDFLKNKYCGDCSNDTLVIDMLDKVNDQNTTETGYYAYLLLM